MLVWKDGEKTIFGHLMKQVDDCEKYDCLKKSVF